MQRLAEIKRLLADAGRVPRKGLGQSFLIDANLMGKLLELAGLTGQETVLEVGAGTGSLTEELLERVRRVVAVELDDWLAGVLRHRLGGREGVTILHGDVLAGKHALSGEVLAALAGCERVQLVANLPYAIAVPVVVNCLVSSWRTARQQPGVRFDRLTLTVQRELADRLTGAPGGSAYGPAGVIVALLSRAKAGRAIPPEAFWPRPKVRSQMLRLDFDAGAAARLADAQTLSKVLSATFGQRRKKIASSARGRGFPFPAAVFLAALAQAGIDPNARPEQVSPPRFRALANALTGPT